MAITNLPILRKEATDPQIYHQAVWGRVFNQRRNESRVPRAVVKASTTEHIKATVELANQENCRVSIRSGGHSWGVWSVRHGAILLDLGDYKYLDYNEQSRIVACSPSTTSQELMEFLEAKGRMFGTGHCGEVALGGFLLGGGQGWNAKNWGHSVEQMVGVDVVTAEGEELHCSIAENEDLFWLARGGGPGFPGVITRFYLQTRPSRFIFRSTIAWPVSEWSSIMPWVLEVCDEFDTDSEVCCVTGYPPNSPISLVILMFITFKNSIEEAEVAIRPVKDDHPSGAVLEQYCNPSTFAQEFVSQTFATPHGHHYYVDNVWLSNDADVTSLMEKSVQSVPNKTSLIMYMPVTSSQRPVNGNIAFSLQSKHYVSLYGGWKESEDEEDALSWVRNTISTLDPYGIGSIVSDFDFQNRETRHWDEPKGERVMVLRKQWDPNGRFAGFLDGDDKSGVEGIKTSFL